MIRMTARVTILATVSALTLMSCAETMSSSGAGSGPSGQVSGSADPAPGTIGGRDDLRLGEAPPALPSQIEVGSFDPEADGSEEEQISQMRQSALSEAAKSYGSQMGLARRSYEIGKVLENRSGQLSGIFDFNRVAEVAPVQAGYIVPPIVSRSFEAFSSNAEGTEASVADEYLTVVAPGRIRSNIPTWHEYLLMSSSVPSEPARSLLPRNEQERLFFRQKLNEGWVAGVDLADTELERRLDRLRRDYEGMLQYRRLVQLGMMDRMVLADADFGVTGSENEMRIGSRTVRVVSEAAFNTNPRTWTPQTVTERDRMIVETGELPEIIDEVATPEPPTVK